MSDDKQIKVKRVAPLPKPAPEAVTEPVLSALRQPELMAALPVPVPRRPRSGTEKLFSAYQTTLASIGQSQSAVAADVTAMALEMSGLARSNLTEAGDSFTALLKAKSLTEAVEIQLGFARRSLDAMVGGSTRLGEIGLRLANDAAKPVLGRFPG